MNGRNAAIFERLQALQGLALTLPARCKPAAANETEATSWMDTFYPFHHFTSSSQLQYWSHRL